MRRRCKSMPVLPWRIWPTKTMATESHFLSRVASMPSLWPCGCIIIRRICKKWRSWRCRNLSKTMTAVLRMLMLALSRPLYRPCNGTRIRPWCKRRLVRRFATWPPITTTTGSRSPKRAASRLSNRPCGSTKGRRGCKRKLVGRFTCWPTATMPTGSQSPERAASRPSYRPCGVMKNRWECRSRLVGRLRTWPATIATRQQ
mmetsp:Transcript_21289/g.47545  ORF Transcript_21289/g.47545 Transcript_21289/m.47545 type:complete len:201 (-) Transcript_21289:136-738(-)